MVELPQNAEGFLKDAKEWFAVLRERYKENLAEQCERYDPDFDANVARIAGKLRVMNDLLSDLSALVDGRRIGEHFSKEGKDNAS